jgi:hypothetical protein
LHELATNAVGGDQIVGDEQPIEVHDVAAHGPGAVQAEAAVDNRVGFGQPAVDFKNDFGKKGMEFQALGRDFGCSPIGS